MHPNGLFLLAVGLGSFVVVCVFAGFLAVKAWRLFKRGLRTVSYTHLTLPTKRIV